MPSSISFFVTAGTKPRIPTTRKTTPKRTAIVLAILSFSFVEGRHLSRRAEQSQAWRDGFSGACPQPQSSQTIRAWGHAPLHQLQRQQINRRQRQQEIRNQRRCA